MDEKQVIAKIAAEFPFPWRYVTAPTGQVHCLDRTNKEVSLFAILDLACLVSRSSVQ